MWRKPEEAKPSSKTPPKPDGVTNTAASASTAPVAAATHVEAPVLPAQVPASPVKFAAPAAPTDGSQSQISAGLKIRGDITGTSDLWIDGDVQGKIQLTGCKLTVGPSGRVKSDIEAREISVFGNVNGNLKAAEWVALGNTGRLEGSVVTKRISIDDGARLRGKVEMIRADAAAPAPAKTAMAASTASVATAASVAAGAAKEKA